MQEVDATSRSEHVAGRATDGGAQLDRLGSVTLLQAVQDRYGARDAGLALVEEWDADGEGGPGRPEARLGFALGADPQGRIGCESCLPDEPESLGLALDLDPPLRKRQARLHGPRFDSLDRLFFWWKLRQAR